MGCGPYRWTEVVVATILGLLAGITAVVGSVTFHQCSVNAWLDYWLIFHGMITLGALMGLMIWRLAPIPGRYINALTYLTGFLFFLNIVWLILGNVAVGLVYSVCYAGKSPSVYLDIPIDCSSRILPLTLSVVIIFDIFYVILMAMLCAQAFQWGPEHDEEDTISYPSRWWIFVIVVVVVLILAVVAIAVGATFLQQCYTEDWGAIWLIIFGSTKIGVVLFGLFWIRYRPEAAKVWDSPTCYLVLPFIVFYLLQVAVLGVGKLLLFEIRADSCDGIAACSDVLLVTEVIVVSLFVLVAAVVIYYGVIFLLVALFFFVVTIYYYCTGYSEKDEDEVVSMKQQEV